jgi:hypothetical protein
MVERFVSTRGLVSAADKFVVILAQYAAASGRSDQITASCSVIVQMPCVTQIAVLELCGALPAWWVQAASH